MADRGKKKEKSSFIIMTAYKMNICMQRMQAGTFISTLIGTLMLCYCMFADVGFGKGFSLEFLN